MVFRVRGLEGWCLELGFRGRGFQLMGFWACGVRPSGFFFGLGLFT